MQYSIVDLSEVVENNKSFRFDAEYLRPDSIKEEEKIKSLKGVRLEDLCSNIVSGPFGSALKSSEYQKEGVPFIRITDMNSFFIDRKKMHHISHKNHYRLKASELKKNDLILSKIGTLGVVSILTPDIGDICNISENNIGLKIDKGTNSEFISTFLNCRIGQDQILRRQSGNVQPKLNVSDINNIYVPLLSNSFQSSIAELVNKAFSLKELAKQDYKKAEDLLLEGLGFKNWESKYKLSYIKNFSDTQEAGRLDAEYFQPKYDEIINKIKAVKHESLGNLFSIKKGIEPGSKEYVEKGIPFLRVSNISPMEISFGDSAKYLSKEYYNSNIDKQPQQGEILISKDGTCGLAYYLSEEPIKMIAGGAILRLSTKENIRSEYLTLVLNSKLVEMQMDRDSGGALINHWLIDQVKSTILPILDCQKEIAELVKQSTIDRAKSKQLLELAKLAVELAIEKDEKQALSYIKENA